MAELSKSARERMLTLHEAAAKDVKLYNFSVAVRARMGSGKQAMWIPVTPSVEGGRPSIYDLPVGGDATLMGTYVTADECVHEYMSRLTDDRYSVRQVTATGNVVFEASGDLTVISADVGYGRIVWEPTQALEGPVSNAVPVHVWVGYSLIKVDVG